jgi:MFS family permease
MVAFGKKLKHCRRIGWEKAYIDYNKLKRILSELENSLTYHETNMLTLNEENDNLDSIPDPADQIRDRFFQELGEEIEKISLFTLKTQGILSEAVGHLRFRDDDTIKVADLFPDQGDSIFRKYYTGIRKERLKDDLEMYLILGVELLFLIQFVGVNTIGVRKVLKKYNKTVQKLNKPGYYYTMGGKDDFHLQQISSSQSLTAIHSSLQSALIHLFYTDDLLSTDPGRELEYFRFQSIVQASYVIRKNSEIVNQPFKDFLSRKAMINVGSKSLGGIEGSEMRAMNVVLNFRPTTMLVLDLDQLDDMWVKWIPQYARWKNEQLGDQDIFSRLQEATKYAMEVLEEEEVDWHTLSQRALIYGTKPKGYGFEEKAWGGTDMPSMILNLLSILLYTINYYIVAPTANHYAIVLGSDGAFGATLIGTSSFSAIIAALLYSFWYTKSSFKSVLIFSAICPLVGNLVYALAISYRSLPMAIFGRFLCGFGSAEVVNRQMISTCVSFKQITRASAFFVAAGAMGMSIGPLIAGILDDTTGRDLLVDLRLPFTPAGGIIFNSITSPGFVMATLWFMQLLALFYFFSEPDRINGTTTTDDDGRYSTDSEATHLMKIDYGSFKGRRDSNNSLNSSIQDTDSVSLSPESEYKVPGFWGEIVATSSLILINPGLPITLLLFCYIELVDEVLISSCSMVVRRYFGWNASTAGFLVAR